MKKLYIVITAIVLAAMLMPACTPTAPDCSLPDVVCAALVTDVGKVDDKSFNQSSWEALQQLKDEGLVDWIQYIETTDSKDYGKNLAVFGDDGYDFIITSGFNLGTASIEGAKLYPATYIIGVDQSAFVFTPAGETTPTNFIGVAYQEDQSGFLVGALAAAMSESNMIGAVAGLSSIPPVWRYGEGYKAGAAYADAQMGMMTEVTVVYHDDVGIDKAFTDPEWGATTADSMLDQGVDVIFGIGGKTGNGAVEAAAARGAYGIGVDKDQYFELTTAAPLMLTSALKVIKDDVYTVIAGVLDGSIMGGGDFAGTNGFAPYHDLEDTVPAEVKTMMTEIQAGLTDGTILTNVPPVKP
jgi:basic membrane protein A